MNKEELFEFCTNWLSSWTGNKPDELLTFYHEDALYIDPANREGLKGHKEIGRYFEKLLDVYHDWTWKPIEVFFYSNDIFFCSNNIFCPFGIRYNRIYIII